MSYSAAVDHLYARGLELASDSSLPTGKRRKFDLEHMRILARALGNPQDRFPAVLIAGTNGKGSTAATLASILTAAGYRTALYTSPHLSRVNERIQIDGQPISDDDFARLYFQVDSTAERLITSGELPQHPSFFETLTALAFLYFAGASERTTPQPVVIPTEGSVAAEVGGPASLQQTPGAPCMEQPYRDMSGHSSESRIALLKGTASAVPQASIGKGALAPEGTAVDIAILEVGLGGRLDATNIVTPLLSIITDISLDHQEYLGNTIAEITREKAGILRPGGTLITLPQHPEANQAIGEVAMELGIHAINAAAYIPHTPVLQNRPGAPFMAQSYRDMSGHSSEARTASLQGMASEPALSAVERVPEAGEKGASSPEGSFLRNRYTITLGGQSLHVDSPLFGQHQQRNIALAIAAVEELRNQTSYKIQNRNYKGYKITNAQIEIGIRNTRWPGRLELFHLDGSIAILLDVAHNPAGAWTLRAALAQFSEELPRTLIFSCLRDKDLREMSQILLPLFDSSSPDRPDDHILFAPINSPRAASLEDLVATAHELEIPAETAPTLAEALDRARAMTPPNGLIVATGSVYLIGELRTLLTNKRYTNKVSS